MCLMNFKGNSIDYHVAKAFHICNRDEKLRIFVFIKEHTKSLLKLNICVWLLCAVVIKT